MKLAWFRATPLEQATALDDTVSLIAELRSSHDITVFTAANAYDFVWMHFRAPYDLCVHELDDTAAHLFIWPYLLQYGGVLYLRTLTLNDSRASALARDGRTADYGAEFAFNRSWAMLRVPLLASHLVVVPHAATGEGLQDEHPDARVRVAHPGVRAVHATPPPRPRSPVTFGVLDRGRLETIDRAVQRAREAGTPAELMVDTADRVLRDADVVLALRWPDSGEPQTPAIAGMSAGKPVVVFEVETTADWPALNPQTWQPRGLGGPEPIVVSIDPRDEEHSLVLAIQMLSTDHALRAKLGAAAQDWWRAHATVAHAAETWRRLLAEAASLERPIRPPDWPAHLSADGTEGARAILAEFGATVDFLATKNTKTV